jgi:hypothetical protein
LSWQQKQDDAGIVSSPIESELGNFVRIDRYQISNDDGRTTVEVATSARWPDGQTSSAKVDRYQGQGSIVLDAESGFISRSDSTVTVASKTPYRDMKVESLTEVQTTMTLKQNEKRE